MNNKEAITVLKNHISPHDDCEADNEANQAIRLAIKAFEFIDENFPKTFIDYLNGEQI